MVKLTANDASVLFLIAQARVKDAKLLVGRLVNPHAKEVAAALLYPKRKHRLVAKETARALRKYTSMKSAPLPTASISHRFTFRDDISS